MKLPMFPLSSVVFPFTAVPLRVFEARYQALLDWVMATDRQFGIVLIERGHEVGGGDTRFGTGTKVRVVAVTPLPGTDDRAIVVAGIQRLRVVSWLPDDPYPMAIVEELAEPAGSIDDVLDAATISLRRVLALASESGADVSGINLAFADDPIAASHQLAALCPLSVIDSQKLLEADGPRVRLALARQLLDGRAELLVHQLSRF